MRRTNSIFAYFLYHQGALASLLEEWEQQVTSIISGTVIQLVSLAGGIQWDQEEVTQLVWAHIVTMSHSYSHWEGWEERTPLYICATRAPHPYKHRTRTSTQDRLLCRRRRCLLKCPRWNNPSQCGRRERKGLIGTIWCWQVLWKGLSGSTGSWALTAPGDIGMNQSAKTASARKDPGPKTLQKNEIMARGYHKSRTLSLLPEMDLEECSCACL